MNNNLSAVSIVLTNKNKCHIPYVFKRNMSEKMIQLNEQLAKGAWLPGSLLCLPTCSFAPSM